MFVFLLPALAAGVLGFALHSAPGNDDYVARVRLVFLGAYTIGLSGIGWFVWQKARGWRRAAALLLLLVVGRVLYAPVIHTAVIETAWLERLAALAGQGGPTALLHYVLAASVAAGAALGGLLMLAATMFWRKPVAVVLLVLFGAWAALLFSHPQDRIPLLHPFASEVTAPSTTGPSAWQIATDDNASLATRARAATAALRHALLPRNGWGGRTRTRLDHTTRGNPNASYAAGLTALEHALRHP